MPHSPPAIEACTAILLAGGKSTRLGSPKAWLPFGERPLLRLLVERLQGAFPEVLVVAAPGQDLPRTPARVVHDEVPEQGPLGGLAAGLRAAQNPLAFAASCDLPFLNPEVGRRLAAAAEGARAAVPEWEGRLQPLHAVYRTELHARAAEEIRAGRRRMTAFVEGLHCVILPEAEVRSLDPEGLTFFNLNTPDDYDRALRLWERYGM